MRSTVLDAIKNELEAAFLNEPERWLQRQHIQIGADQLQFTKTPKELIEFIEECLETHKELHPDFYEEFAAKIDTFLQQIRDPHSFPGAQEDIAKELGDIFKEAMQKTDLNILLQTAEEKMVQGDSWEQEREQESRKNILSAIFYYKIQENQINQINQ